MVNVYYPKYCFNGFSALAVLYTIGAHVWVTLSTGRSRLPMRPFEIDSKMVGKGKVAIVTGSNTGIGYETARALVVDHEMTVILACRSEMKGQAAVQKIEDEIATIQQKSQGKAIFHPLDLSSFDSVRKFAKEIKEKYPQIHVLVNNAGRNTSGESDKLDLLYKTNFLGHFLLTSELMDTFKEQTRVINLSSVMHHYNGGLDIEETKLWKDCALYDRLPDDTYPPSKLAAILFTIELNRRYPERIRSIAVSPGAVNSDIWRGYPPLVIKFFDLVYIKNREGSRPSVVGAVGKLDPGIFFLQPYALPNNSRVPFPVFEKLGPYIGHNPSPPRLPEDGGVRAAAAMWQASEELTDTVFPSEIEVCEDAHKP